MDTKSRIVRVHRTTGDIVFFIERQYTENGEWIRLPSTHLTTETAMKHIQLLKEADGSAEGEVVYTE